MEIIVLTHLTLDEDELRREAQSDVVYGVGKRAFGKYLPQAVIVVMLTRREPRC